MIDEAVLLQNIETIRKNIACYSVSLMAVTKTVDVDTINLAIEKGGIRLIGENRVQELLQKYDKLTNKDELQIHLIGSLQTNKVKYIIDKVDLIHSVDSVKLMQEIQRQALKIGKIQDILFEINIGRETTKGGVLPEDLPELIDYLTECPNIRCKGIMCIPPKTAENNELVKFFYEMKKLLVDNRHKMLDNIDDYILSMGMSGDYLLACKCGSNMIRIGSAIFGKRK